MDADEKFCVQLFEWRSGNAAERGISRRLTLSPGCG
jgi:hypothetical protein